MVPTVKKDVDNISLRPVAAETPAPMSVSTPHTSAPTVSVKSSDEVGYRVCKRMTDFFYTVKAELFKLGTKVRRCFRWHPVRSLAASPVCCGYSRTILGWRL